MRAFRDSLSQHVLTSQSTAAHTLSVPLRAPKQLKNVQEPAALMASRSCMNIQQPEIRTLVTIVQKSPLTGNSAFSRSQIDDVQIQRHGGPACAAHQTQFPVLCQAAVSSRLAVTLKNSNAGIAKGKEANQM